ncbi:hypothetical protein CW304_17520 [Bacillus sp. UFRGS-B20]|nr:hypothetical protein CW304_17520 [Bacillus sp. UFRGS-B20]
MGRLRIRISIFGWKPVKSIHFLFTFSGGYIIRKKVTAEPTIRVKFWNMQCDNHDKQIFEKNSHAPKIADEDC